MGEWGAFLCIYGTYAGGEGVENGSELKSYSIFLRCLKILDANLN
jgi:hypothetical protein